ncbi:MAG: DUF3320 domain-containing protein [Clostridiales bacterium]|nr:DUF3320 domain-containing protein [Clostridiales bacterium]
MENKVQGEIVLSIQSRGQELFLQKNPIIILPYDYWTGANILPELIASFVTPDNIDAKAILKDALGYLKKWRKANSFLGYKGEPNRVFGEAASIFCALKDRELNISFIDDSRSLGQVVNLNNALQNKTATLTEAALLYASLLEKIGLNPILAVFERYILVGAWLGEDTFADCVNADLAELSKKSALGELFLANPKFLDKRNFLDFNSAMEWSKEPLANEAEFIYFTDIKRCRLSHIYPMPKRVWQDGWRIEYSGQEQGDLKPKKLKIFSAKELDEPLSKQKYWERKLLDLTLKNSLLNFKITKNTLPVLADAPNNLATHFCNGNEYDILPIMKEAQDLAVDFNISQGARISSIYSKLLNKELSKGKLRSALDENRLKSTITNIYRKYKYNIEEKGVCALYLAVGLLKWYESENSQRPLYAPLILIPLDLIRKSAKRYILKARDDESHFNITLLEMLRQQYSLEAGGLDPLPKNSDNSINVFSVFNIVRKLVMHQHGWDIIEESYISNFSFSGIVMWHDIRNRLDSFQKTPIVKALISGIPFNKTSLEINDIDERWLKEQIILPIEADSSQLEAIYFANKDMSFVLHGPPGTGKSQTITNIIANALLRGKRVLFVAEKMAALSVVKNRLEEIGIGDFCLELHSDKTSKKEVLENLKKTSEIVKVYEPEDFKSVQNRLEKTRQALAVYMQKLHRPQKYGFSLFEAIDEYISYDFLDQFELDQDIVINFDKDKIELLENKLYELKALGQDMGHPNGSDLEHIGQTEYSLSLKLESAKAVNKFLAAIRQLRGYCEILRQAIDINAIDEYEQFCYFIEICSYLSQNYPETPHLEELQDDALEKLFDYAKLGIKTEQIKSALSARYNLDAFRPVNQKLIIDYTNAKGLKKAFKKRKILKQLKKAAKTGVKYKDNFLQDFQQVFAYQQNLKSLQKSQGFVFDTVPQYKSQNYLAVLQSLEEYSAYKKSLSLSALTQDQILKLKSIPLPQSLKSDYEKFKTAKSELDSLLKIDFRKIQSARQWWLNTLSHKAALWSMDSLKERCAYNQLREELVNMGLKPVTDAYDKGLDHDVLVPSFRKAMLKAIIEHIVVNDNELNKFTGRLFEEKIRRFKELEQKYRLVSRQLLSARLKMNLPNFDIKSSQMSELGIFQRAIKGSARNITLKKLFEQIPNILPKVAPCVLMSPVTVAQYINPQEPFDLLIFDEASQLTTAKAVGSLSRTKTAIIVGDPKQLPPTTFFENINTNEEDILSEDLESVLDDCLALNMPEIHLRWHYRSKDESLIAFSNRLFYDNSLNTFPSPSGRQSAIKFVKVNGVYDRGKTKQNIEEALAVTEEVIKRLSHPELRKYSIGIVTFSIVQQNLIDDMLTETFRQSPRLEQYAMKRSEPLFVKNLENVQGDERDVILFSVCYGKDARGKLSLNFGPLNREGGWRRLNVAVSRAKYEMVVFSSITYDMINPAATTAQGVKALRGFLEYAQKGQDALSYKASHLQVSKQGLEEQMVNMLRQKGYDGLVNYGTSGYKINVAIKDPDNPDKFILGVMCDSIGYSKVKTVKDREISPFNVLKKLGWNIMRVWSLDFWDSPEKVINKIVKKIESLRKAGGVIIDDEDDIDIIDTPEDDLKEAVVQNALQAEYKAAAVPQKIIPSSYFSTELNQPHLIRITKMIIDAEYPVSYRVILKRVLASSGITRSGSRIEAQMRHVLDHIKCDSEIEGNNVFYWKKGANKKKYNIYRVNSNRNMDDISVYEIINAVRYIVQNQISLPKEALEEEVFNIFGAKKTEEGLRQIRRAIRYGLDNNIITSQNGKILAGENLTVFE